MSAIILGKTAAGHNLKLDLDLLLRTRLLIQGGSGSGKSWLLRRLAEQLFGKLPVIILDPEGEFATLREQHGYVLVGKGGETPADPRSAALVAEKLLELHASAVCDLYELKPSERHRWVKLFLEALIDAPKQLWQSAIIIVDEAHLFAPEKGAGESEASEAMIALTSRGRKRGFCPIFATQRLGKLRKDAAAELLNVLIGNTFIDIDRDRAAESLGVPKKDKPAFFDQVKVLKEGQFWALGRALTIDRTLVQIGGVETSHPKAGFSKHGGELPPAPEKVRALMPKLADLPAAAEERQRSLAELRKDNADKTRRIKELERAASGFASSSEGAKQEVKRVEVLTDGDRDLLRKLGDVLAAIATSTAGLEKRALEGLGTDLDRAKTFYLLNHSDAAERAEKALMQRLDSKGFQKILEKLATHNPQPRTPERSPNLVGQRPAKPPRLVAPVGSSPALSANLQPAKQKILNGLAFLAGIGVPQADKTQLALIVGVSPTSGGYFNNLGGLRSAGLIEYPTGGTVALTPQGAELARTEGIPETTEELHDAIRAKLPPAKWKILEALIPVYPKSLTKDELAEQIGVSPTSGGYFNNLGSLRSLGLVTYPRASEVAVQPVLFLEGQ